jgi:hypothetical protein
MTRPREPGWHTCSPELSRCETGTSFTRYEWTSCGQLLGFASGERAPAVVKQSAAASLSFASPARFAFGPVRRVAPDAETSSGFCLLPALQVGQRWARGERTGEAVAYQQSRKASSDTSLQKTFAVRVSLRWLYRNSCERRPLCRPRETSAKKACLGLITASF